jgi:release factor glutamine methyltransferase
MIRPRSWRRWRDEGRDALRAAVARLRAAGVEDAARDARLLLAHALGIAPTALTLHLHDAMTEGRRPAAFETAIAARARRQPVAQITGERQFWGLQFRVTRDTLDPRPETEALVAEALRTAVRTSDAGSGHRLRLHPACLPAETARWRAPGLAPISVAPRWRWRKNAARLGLAGRADFPAGNWFDAVPGLGFDLIVSNPPYIAADEMAAFRPRSATGSRIWR